MSRLYDAIREALRHYRCTHWQQDEDNGGLPLPDALTPPWGDGTVRMGMEEIDLIADEVADALDALGKPFCWCVESANSADWAFAATKEAVQNNAKLMDRDCIKSEPFPLYRAAVESLAPKENQRVFAVNVLGTPMREYEPGKWEVARWPSLAAPAGDEWQAEFERLRRRVEDVYFAWMMPCKENDAQTQLYRNLNKARASLLAHARQRVQPASEEQPEQPKQPYLAAGDASRPDGSEAPPDGWKLVAVNEGFEPLMAALARAHSKGYMPNAITDDYEGFDYQDAASPVSAPEPASQRELLRECENALVAAKEVMSWIDENSHNPPTVRYARENEQKADAALAKLREHLNLKEKS